MTRARINWDAMGVITSVACAIHCSVLPLVLVSLHIFGVDILRNNGFEYFMIGLAFLIGSGSLWHGYRRHHGFLRPWLLFSLGMLLLLAKEIWHQYELWLLPFAVLCIITAHFTNFRACKAHRGVKKHGHFPLTAGKPAN